jgi:hypothetical protein
MTDTQNTPNPQDSKTLGAQAKTRFTDKLNVKCDPIVKQKLVQFCNDNGLSICQVFDALARAYVVGIQQMQQLGAQSPTINLTIERQVKRVRRYAREFVGFVDEGKKYCGLKDGFVDVGDLPLNECRGCIAVKCREFALSRNRELIERVEG